MADKKKILIADDFQLLREDLTELINNQRDMEVVGTASSGKETVNLARNTEYDLILMDIEMETMNAGILATQEIREADPEAGIIFLTAHETREMIVTAMGAGALDYIVKGCEDEEILYHIRCALKGNPIMSNKIHETVMQEYARLQQSEKSLLFFINNILRASMLMVMMFVMVVILMAVMVFCMMMISMQIFHIMIMIFMCMI
jgi:DNA-binding NarL/FixJ family response regulator